MKNEDRIFEAFYKAGMFLLERVRNDDWLWCNNYLREHARAAGGVQFTNTISPAMLKRLRDTFPSMRPYIDGANSKQQDDEPRLGL